MLIASTVAYTGIWRLHTSSRGVYRARNPPAILVAVRVAVWRGIFIERNSPAVLQGLVAVWRVVFNERKVPAILCVLYKILYIEVDSIPSPPLNGVFVKRKPPAILQVHCP